MKMNRRKALGVAAAIGASAPEVLTPKAQSQTAPAQTAQAQPADPQLEIARQQRLRDAQRIATVKIPQSLEPAFQFRP